MSRLRYELLKYRNKKNLTQEQLAQILGCQRAALSRWEIDDTFPRPALLKKISEVIGVSVDLLLDKDEPEEEPDPLEDTAAVSVAFYNQHGVVSKQQQQMVEDFIKLITKGVPDDK